MGPPTFGSTRATLVVIFVIRYVHEPPEVCYRSHAGAATTVARVRSDSYALHRQDDTHGSGHIPTDTDQTGRAGVALCDFVITNDLGLVFREQETSDFGVDAQVEIKREGLPTGRLVGLQIKSGPSWFAEAYEEGWIFRPKPKHIPYWLNHSLPMFVLLVDLVEKIIYWQEISERTLQTGDRGGVHVRVPRSNVLATARDPWETAADEFAATAADDYKDNLERLAPSTASLVRRLAEASPDDAALLCAHLARGRHTPELTVRTLLVSAAPWIASHGSAGYAVLADFAHSHGIEALAADTLLIAAAADPSQQLRYTTNAGLISLHVDRARARELLEVARNMSTEFSGRIEIGFLVLGHPATRAAPIPISDQISQRLTVIDNDAVVSHSLQHSSSMPATSTRLSISPTRLWLLNPRAGSTSTVWRACSPVVPRQPFVSPPTNNAAWNSPRKPSTSYTIGTGRLTRRYARCCKCSLCRDRSQASSTELFLRPTEEPTHMKRRCPESLPPRLEQRAHSNELSWPTHSSMPYRTVPTSDSHSYSTTRP